MPGGSNVEAHFQDGHAVIDGVFDGRFDDELVAGAIVDVRVQMLGGILYHTVETAHQRRSFFNGSPEPPLNAFQMGTEIGVAVEVCLRN